MPTHFTATVSAGNAAAAEAKVTRRLAQVAGFRTTGRVEVRSARHGLYDVTVADNGGDRDDCWTVLTSYGISPSADLGSVWESTLGASA